MSLEEISHNVSGLKKNLETVFSNHENFIWNESKTNKDAKLKPVVVLNNQDWYKSINLVQFLREYGRQFRYYCGSVILHLISKCFVRLQDCDCVTCKD